MLKNILGLLGWISSVQAEVVVILPEPGPLVRAGLKIRQRIISTDMEFGQPVLIKWVNTISTKISNFLKSYVTHKSAFIGAALVNLDIAALLKANRYGE